MITELTRKGSFQVNYSKEEVFPLLCPKIEEKWIPGWKCQVIKSQSGYNEKGAIFKTETAFNTELIWCTNEYDIETGNIDFILFAKDKYVFRFNIKVVQNAPNSSELTFTHSFSSLSNEGSALIEAYKNEDFQGRLNTLGMLIETYLKTN
ncbi:MAG TPA: hypothetical protein PK252_13255 [Bacteroidales bacterium]|nr:hypothetical protein [Bacteroidales bacterium]